MRSPRRKRGRPATGHNPSISARLPAKTVAAVLKFSRWAGISRATAIRRLVELGLNAQETDRKIHELAEAISLLAAAIDEIRKDRS
jgi:hypothetical protein